MVMVTNRRSPLCMLTAPIFMCVTTPSSSSCLSPFILLSCRFSGSSELSGFSSPPTTTLVPFSSTHSFFFFQSRFFRGLFSALVHSFSFDSTSHYSPVTMKYLRLFLPDVLIRAFFVLLLGGWASVSPVTAAMSPTEIELACNGLARMAFDLKDLVNTVAAKRNPGPFQVRRSTTY